MPPSARPSHPVEPRELAFCTTSCYTQNGQISRLIEPTRGQLSISNKYTDNCPLCQGFPFPFSRKEKHPLDTTQEDRNGSSASPTFPPVQPNLQETPGRRDMTEHRARILSAARVLLAKYGIDVVSMHQIAREAQVGQGTLYRHFAHKGLLCLALLQEDLMRFQHNLLSYFEQAGDTVPTLEQLRFFLRQIAIFNDEQASLLNAIHASTGDEHRSFACETPLIIWLREVVIVLLHRAIERQELAPLDTEYAAHAILAPLSIDLYYYQRNILGYDQERILSGLEHLLFHGLRP